MRSPVRRVVSLCALSVLLACAITCVACASGGNAAQGSNSSSTSQNSAEIPSSANAPTADLTIADRGPILARDGSPLAETTGSKQSGFSRNYALGPAAEPLAGSCYTHGAPEGIEQLYADELASGNAIMLTVDARMQEAAYESLGGHVGAIVVMDPDTGAILAMASAPAYDPALGTAGDEVDLEQRTTELHIPGSTFKTITLAAALESGASTLNTRYMGPAEITFQGGSVVNYNTMQYPDQTLLQAYAKSINTIFAQLTLDVGFDVVYDMARRFGYERELMSDYPLRASFICNADALDTRMKAWTGVGQALYQLDGELQGPLMSPVHGAAIAAVAINGGRLVEPYVVERVGDAPSGEMRPVVLDEGFLSQQTLEALQRAMRAVVAEGTGANARVDGVDVGGKTGTAETVTGNDDAWFAGFAQAGERRYAVCVLLEGEQSTDAARVASGLIRALFE